MMKAKLKFVAKKKNWVLVYEDGKEMQVARRAPSADLYPLDPQKHDGLEVEYELENGQPVKIRELGVEWRPQAASPPQVHGRPKPGGRGKLQHANRASQSSQVRPPGPFHNPYNFIPAPPRILNDPELGDHKPAGHDRYHHDLWSGRIAVKLTTHTPLLIHDAGQMQLYKDDPIINHKIFPVRLDANGQPYLAPTSVKGMLRSAFEAVTNSRFGVFEKHEVCLSYREKNSRKSYSASPNDLLPDCLKPARRISELSPADRVFGWVQQSSSQTNGKKASNGHTAYKGNLRIGPVSCVTRDPLEHFDYPGLPLAILGQPKPQQARFYVAETKQGEAQRIGISKAQAGYFSHKGLRGRKVYPHHRNLPEAYWQEPLTDRTQVDSNGFFQEYRRPKNDKGERDDQNRSITSWVKPQVTFEFDIDVTNLTSVELGALLWLLTLPGNHFHRLGGGKPLGFGSVHLAVAWKDTSLHKGDWWQASYRKLDEESKLYHNQIPAELQDCINGFIKSVAAAYGGGNFDQVSFIAAFKHSAEGFADGKPLYYPRALQRGQRPNGTIPPHPDGKGYEWFVANERPDGPKLSLADLVNDDGLPLLEAGPPERRRK